MDQLSKILTIKKNTQDLSGLAYTPRNNNMTVQLNTTDYLYISNPAKPIGQVYIDVQTPNTIPCELVVESSQDGSTGWIGLSGCLDETAGATKSGYLIFGTTTNKYLRVKPTVNTSTMLIRSISGQLCSEQDMIIKYPAIVRFYPRDFNSHISAIEDTTREIVQLINNKAGYKLNGTDATMINRYDLWNYNEVRVAATCKALSKAIRNLSDTVGDNYKSVADSFEVEFMSNFKNFEGSFISIDINDNGENDDEDKDAGINFGTVRFVR